MYCGKDKILYRTIKADRLSSIILYGPPGCGKTSLARVISKTTKYGFYKINAVTSGVADIKKVVEEAKNIGIAQAQQKLEGEVENKELIVDKKIYTKQNENYVEVEVIYEVLENIGTKEKIVFWKEEKLWKKEV